VNPNHSTLRRVPGEGAAAWLLGLFTSQARAEAIVGDLSEQSRDRSTAWFWQSTLRIAAASARQSLFSIAPRETETTSTFSVLGAIWQHKWVLVACVLASIAVTRVALLFYPARYRSAVVLTVTPPGIPDEYVHRPKPSVGLAERLQSIQAQVLSRTRLERIVNDFDLYEDARKHLIIEDIVRRMRRDISVTLIAGDTFRVSFDGDKPQTTQKVTEALTALIIAQNLEESDRIAGFTAQFLAAEIQQVRDQLIAEETKRGAAARAGHSPARADSIEYDVLQQAYRDLLTKHESASTTQLMEERQVGEQFRVRDPARLPTEPITPNRAAATTGGAMAGLGLGVAVIAFITRRRPLANDDRDFEEGEVADDPASLGFRRRLWTHKWLLVACMLVSLAATSAWLRFFPPRYRSVATLGVVPPLVSDEYVHSPKTDDVAKRLATIEQQAMSRTRLERIVTEFDLYKHEREHSIMEDVIQRMRGDIHLEMDGNDFFRVSFTGTDPRKVYRVTDRLMSLLISEDLEERSRFAESTHQFIAGQLEDTRQHLTEVEARLNDGARAGRTSTRADAIDYEVVQQEYRDLLVKRLSFHMAATLERGWIGEHVRVVDFARVPEEPIAPNRLAINAGGALTGFGIGVALIAITTRRRPLAGDRDHEED
jgi:uncharacterized protein involved in exopolysaccharide biosynthesis